MPGSVSLISAILRLLMMKVRCSTCSLQPEPVALIQVLPLQLVETPLEPKSSHPHLRLDQPAVYKIKVQGQLDKSWSEWFSGMDCATDHSPGCAAITTLFGTVADQVALYGVLSRIRDLGLPLLLVQCVEFESEIVHCDSRRER